MKKPTIDDARAHYVIAERALDRAAEENKTDPGTERVERYLACALTSSMLALVAGMLADVSELPGPDEPTEEAQSDPVAADGA